MNNKVVYSWFDASECFYIGIGSISRSRSKNRNKFANAKRRKSKDFSIQILHTGLSESMAAWYERNYIRQLGRRDLGTGTLTNLTNGGEQQKGCSPETKEKLRQANLGKKLSKETRKKISEGCKGKIDSRETKRKRRESLTGIKRTKETKEKLSKLAKERYNKGELSHLKTNSERQRNVPRPEKDKQRISETMGTTVITPKGRFSSINKARIAHKCRATKIKQLANDVNNTEYYYETA